MNGGVPCDVRQEEGRRETQSNMKMMRRDETRWKRTSTPSPSFHDILLESSSTQTILAVLFLGHFADSTQEVGGVDVVGDAGRSGGGHCGG